MPEGDIDHVYALLLHLFKLAYQRQRALMNDSSVDWRYSDLSRDETVRDVLAKHRLLAETIYNNPGFRSEFVSLAKLWHEERLESAAQHQEATVEIQTKFEFISYDKLVERSVGW